MIKISQQETAVLGVLFEHHHYSYRINEIMKKRGMDKWADVEYLSLNLLLNNLEEKKLVESKLNGTGDETSKKVYYITDAGKFVLKEKITSILSQQGKIIYPFDLGLANISILSQSELIQSLELYLQSIEKRIQSLEFALKIQKENEIPFNFIAIYSKSLPLLKTEKEWMLDFLEKIKTQ